MTIRPTALLVVFMAVLMTGCGDGTGPTPSPTRSPAKPTPTLAPAPGEDELGDQLLYLALGDSLSEGRAASDPKRTAWVPLVATALGDRYELLNLGVAGHDSRELIEEGPLEMALAVIADRERDRRPGNEVAAITLEIGGNDLLDLYFNLVLPGLCPTIQEGLQRRVCVDELRSAIDDFVPNLRETLDALQAATPETPIFLMTLYNPFSGGSYNLEQIGILALEGMLGTAFSEGLNDEIRRAAENREGVHIVEWYEPFLGKQREYISLDFIHPNDVGYAVLADAVIEAMRETDLP